MWMTVQKTPTNPMLLLPRIRSLHGSTWFLDSVGLLISLIQSSLLLWASSLCVNMMITINCVHKVYDLNKEGTMMLSVRCWG